MQIYIYFCRISTLITCKTSQQNHETLLCRKRIKFQQNPALGQCIQLLYSFAFSLEWCVWCILFQVEIGRSLLLVRFAYPISTTYNHYISDINIYYQGYCTCIMHLFVTHTYIHVQNNWSIHWCMSNWR